jgi:hypothetical protein
MHFWEQCEQWEKWGLMNPDGGPLKLNSEVEEGLATVL